MKVDVYKMVTDKILEAIEKGVCPWHCPWVNFSNGGSNFVNYVSRKEYSLLNCMLLGRPGEYLSRKQIEKLGGTLKSDAEPKMVVFYSQYEYETTDDDGETQKHRIPLLRYYNVFHVEDVEGITPKGIAETKGYDHTEEEEDEIFSAADAVIDDYRLFRKCKMSFGSSNAYYRPLSDEISVPSKEQYKNLAEFYSTTFHEMVHSTGAEQRLNRKEVTDTTRFGSEPYGREELCAEIGSAMLMQICGIKDDAAFKNSAAYLKGWRDTIKTDNKAIVLAACRAEKAVKYILFQYEPYNKAE